MGVHFGFPVGSEKKVTPRQTPSKIFNVPNAVQFNFKSWRSLRVDVDCKAVPSTSPSLVQKRSTCKNKNRKGVFSLLYAGFLTVCLFGAYRDKERLFVRTANRSTRKRRCPSSQTWRNGWKNNCRTRVHPMMLHYLRCCCVESSPGRNIKTQKKKKNSKERRHGRADFDKWDVFFFLLHMRNCVRSPILMSLCLVRRRTELFMPYARDKTCTWERKFLDMSSKKLPGWFLFAFAGGLLKVEAHGL